ncbi:DUF1905 domain-containing protein [Emticicia sp. CRIBPO]|uniref:YdeI/OmpD-associated family protein n=1 Tax=Emticicia sp. CRIBPO TaxID=2683258 RepID=UPI0014123C3E|nr:YdeI/OmpD-associated family protein [Emticicia sp. CRIBPO]NBA89187.1 DUF1905 domain-containing protein [Emticicia sp. CRIBPO]
MEKALVDQTYQLKKFPGKGGWTYAVIDEINADKTAPFGWRRVRGTIDGFEIKAYHLMPIGDGRLFLPVKAEIRKKIKKEEGDHVHVILYRDNLPTEVPEELLFCLEEEPEALKNFERCTDSERKAFVDWIYSAKKEETKAERILKMLDQLKKGKTLYDQKI